MLEPLESRCFTYSPSERGLDFDGNGSHPLPFVFQWCHKGRATIRVENNRDRRQIDLGVEAETIVSLGSFTLGDVPRETLYPTVMQRFSGGPSCPPEREWEEEEAVNEEGL
ncbi:unnamed protein product, partial [Laminaria digitata]